MRLLSFERNIGASELICGVQSQYPVRETYQRFKSEAVLFLGMSSTLSYKWRR